MAKFGWCMDALQWGSERLHGECFKVAESGGVCDCPCHADDPVVIAALKAKAAALAPTPRKRKTADVEVTEPDDDEQPDEENDR